MKSIYSAFIFDLIIILLILDLYRAGDGTEWGYKTGMSFKSPAQWKDILGSSCGGRRQSPIDIRTRDVQYFSALQPISITGNVSNKVSLIKDAMSIKLNFNSNWKIQFGKNGCLRPVHIHWHWGSSETNGSEHTVDGRAYPIEGHLVSYNCEIYNDASKAMGGASGLYVIGFFYQIGDPDQAISKIVSPFNTSISYSTMVDEISPLDFLPSTLHKYYRYEGSLTTPPCTENVIWTVMADTMNISKAQLDSFRGLQFGPPESGNMTDNYRPVVANINMGDYVKRVIYSSFNFSLRTTYSAALLQLSTLLVVFYNSF